MENSTEIRKKGKAASLHSLTEDGGEGVLSVHSRLRITNAKRYGQRKYRKVSAVNVAVKILANRVQQQKRIGCYVVTKWILSQQCKTSSLLKAQSVRPPV